MTEEEYGRLLLAHEKQDGHRKKLPRGGDPDCGGGASRKLNHAEVAKLIAQGMPHRKIAEKLGSSRARIGQLAGRLKRNEKGY